MKVCLKIFLFSLLISVSLCTNSTDAQSDTIRYLFMGHPRDDDRSNEHVLNTVEKLDYSKFELLLLGGDLTWNTSELTSTMEYCNTIFNLGDSNTHLAIGNHDDDNIARLLSYTQKDRYYSFCRNNLTFIILDTELSTPNISGEQLDLIKSVADTIEVSDYLLLIHHRILWMADNPDLEHLKESVAASSRSLSSSNFFDEVYPELQKVKNKGIPVYCIAGDRTDINIEYSFEDSIRFIASGMVGTFPDTNNFAVVFNHLPKEQILNYELVPLSALDTLHESPVQTAAYGRIPELSFRIYPNPSAGKLTILFKDQGIEDKKVEIFSAQGNRLFVVDIPEFDNEYTMDLSSLKNGIYYIRIINHNTTLSKILVKTGKF